MKGKKPTGFGRLWQEAFNPNAKRSKLPPGLRHEYEALLRESYKPVPDPVPEPTNGTAEQVDG